MNGPSRFLRSPAGFTLIELVLTIVILGFTVQLLFPFFQAVEHSADPVVRERSVALAQALMDEVLSKRWDENTPVGGGPLCSGEGGTGRGSTVYGVALDCSTEAVLVASGSLGQESGETRLTYNDVDDYASMAAENNTFVDQAGVVFTMSGYSRSVQVDYVSSHLAVINVTTAGAGGTTDSKRIRVTVTNPLVETVQLLSVVCNF